MKTNADSGNDMSEELLSRIVTLEEKARNQEQRIVETREGANVKFSELKADMDKRFSSVDTKFDSLSKELKAVGDKMTDGFKDVQDGFAKIETAVAASKSALDVEKEKFNTVWKTVSYIITGIAAMSSIIGFFLTKSGIFH